MYILCMRLLDPLELELQTVVSCHLGAGNPGSLEEQTVLLTTELTLQAPPLYFLRHGFSLNLELIYLARVVGE